jgi:hypothetical protein
MKRHLGRLALVCVVQAICVGIALGAPVEYDYTGSYTADANTVALFHFDEGSGLTTADASPNGNNLTLASTSVGWTIPGKFDKSYAGYAAGFTAEDSASLDSLYHSVTLESWLYIPTDVSMAVDNYRGIITKMRWGGKGPYDGFAFAFMGRGVNISESVDLRFQIGGGCLIATAADGVPIGEWFHVAATLDTDGTQRIYLNGQLLGERAEPGRKILANDQPLRVNQWLGATASSFYMAFDEVRISNVALTPVPEPATMTLLATGLVGLMSKRMRRRA